MEISIMRQLGTVLPTAESLAAGDAHAAKIAGMKARVAQQRLAECERRLVGCEYRYYRTPTCYGVVNALGKVLWFEVRKDGDFGLGYRDEWLS